MQPFHRGVLLVRRFEVGPSEAGERLDVYLARRLPEHSRARIARAIRDGLITVSGKTAKPGLQLAKGQTVLCRDIPNLPPSEDLQAEAIPLDIVYEDEHLLVVNKPPGMASHPGPGVRSGTLVHALLGRGGSLAEGSAPFRPGIVHRLDKDTSGLLLVAKTDAAHWKLSRMIARREVTRLYECIVVGSPREDRFTVDAAIGRHPKNRKKMAVLPEDAPGARAARTDFEVIERFRGFALLHARLHTGRTHQVRVHLASIGLPILGDATYGSHTAGRDVAASLVGQALHAFRLELRHPFTDHPLSLVAARPLGWKVVLRALGPP
ncbi:MAG: pseudouridine synthase [Fimbriimonadales bacterium]